MSSLDRLFLAIIKRDNTVVPAVCYATCNNAFIEAQSLGKTPELCAPDSVFLSDLAACNTCVIANSGSSALTTQANGALLPFLSFCSAQITTEPTLSSLPPEESSTFAGSTLFIESTTSIPSALNPTQIESLLAQQSTVASITSVLFQSYLSLQAEVSSLQAATVTQTPNATLASGASLTTAPLHVLSKSSSHAWIAAAVVVPVMLIAILILVVIWIRRRKNPVENEQVVDPNPLEKAQLHSESMKVVRHELDTGRVVDRRYELPALEPVGSELGC